MRKRINAAVAVFLLCLCLCGCSWENGIFGVEKILSGEIVETVISPPEQRESWNISIENISFSNSENAWIQVVYDPQLSIEARYNRDLEKYGFAVTFENGTVRIGTKDRYRFRTDCFQVVIHAPFREIELYGGCKLDIKGEGAEELALNISGAADCSLSDLETQSLAMDVAGAANVSAAGKTESFTLCTAGACNVEAGALQCGRADIDINGAGNAVLSVLDHLQVRIDGIGTVCYYGTPSLEKEINGAGTVEKKGSSYLE